MQTGGRHANWITGFSLTINSTAGSSKNISDTISFNEKEKTYLKDPSKPDGEACNNDGTLKDASELEWPDSPSQPSAFGFQNETEGMWDYWNLDNASRASTVSNLLLDWVKTDAHLHQSANTSHQILDSEDENLISQKQKNWVGQADSDEENDKSAEQLTSTANKKRRRLTAGSEVQTPKSNTEGLASTVVSNDGDSEQDDGKSEVESDGGDDKDVKKQSKVCDNVVFQRWFV